MTSLTATRATVRPRAAPAGIFPDLESDLARARRGQQEVIHGYLPPAQPPGSIVVAYCGEPMVVRGEFTAEPPLDTCAECVAIWEHQRRAADRRAAGRPPGV